LHYKHTGSNLPLCSVVDGNDAAPTAAATAKFSFSQQQLHLSGRGAEIKIPQRQKVLEHD